MVLSQVFHFPTTIDTAMAVGRFNFLPLRWTEVGAHRTSFARFMPQLTFTDRSRIRGPISSLLGLNFFAMHLVVCRRLLPIFFTMCQVICSPIGFQLLGVFSPIALYLAQSVFRIFIWHGANLRCWGPGRCAATRRKRVFGMHALAAHKEYITEVAERLYLKIV